MVPVVFAFRRFPTLLKMGSMFLNKTESGSNIGKPIELGVEVWRGDMRDLFSAERHVGFYYMFDSIGISGGIKYGYLVP